MAEAADKPTRGTRRRERSRAALISAARDVMGQKGVDATTIADITEAADLGFGTFYNHFKTKDEIVEAAMAELVTVLGDQIDALIGTIDDPFFAQVVAWNKVVESSISDPVIGWFIMRSAKTMGIMNEGLMGRFHRDAEAGVKAGHFQIKDMKVVSILVGAGILAIINGRLLGTLDEAQVQEGIALIISHLGISIEEARGLARRPLPRLS
ncbi:MAG: TetR/AcrR family transcriptional regulator [Parvibaculum sp.]